ncbi:EndoU domain-containing protein [Aequorivita echinoideorum]|uniref:EndoU domain-containing protein n=1 Tax=Aequorivita echinoideorum TaxID=1549647 RepID=A0ABS5S0P3_9FLAO|nr:EndoU domain-containing protein [Aequorivita echinoideorum]MBT0606786.1 EndoU domain-containing protein [Aequorivita echinoideorum]
MEYHYYILRNGTSTDKQALKTGTFIVRIPNHYPFNFTDGNGPYKSLRAIKRYSPIYQLLKRSNPRRAQQIVEEKNIIKSDKLIAIPKGTKFKPDVVEGFIHATIGRIKIGDLTGIHFFDPDKVRIIETLEKSEKTSVFKAKFEFYDVRTKKWIEKKTASTFFPLNWNLATLLMECKFAFDRLNEEDLNDGKIKSVTQSNIEVEMIIKNGKLKSLYPLI